MLAFAVCFPQPCSSAVVACLPHQDHVYVATDELLHFHKNKFDQIPCKLECTENLRLILMRILEIYKRKIWQSYLLKGLQIQVCQFWAWIGFGTLDLRPIRLRQTYSSVWNRSPEYYTNFAVSLAHTHAHAYTHKHIFLCTHVRANTHTHTHTYTHTHTHTHTTHHTPHTMHPAHMTQHTQHTHEHTHTHTHTNTNTHTPCCFQTLSTMSMRIDADQCQSKGFFF